MYNQYKINRSTTQYSCLNSSRFCSVQTPHLLVANYDLDDSIFRRFPPSYFKIYDDVIVCAGVDGAAAGSAQRTHRPSLPPPQQAGQHRYN